MRPNPQYWREKLAKRLEDLWYIPPECIPTFLYRGQALALQDEAQALLALAIEAGWMPENDHHWEEELVVWGQHNGLVILPPSTLAVDVFVKVLSGRTFY